MKNNAFVREVRFILDGHILNPFWISREERRRRRCLANYHKVESYFEKYKSFVSSLSLTEDNFKDSAEKEKVFSIWFQGEENAPALVKICFDRLRSVYGDRFIVLDNKTLNDWITLPSHIMEKWEKKKITAAHFSDICRVELLYQYGGMWFDATDYLTEPVPQWIEDADIFIYRTGDVITPHRLIQSCFMRARKGHPLFGAWRKFIFEYWKNENKLVDYFLLHFMLRFIVENNEKASEYFYNMPQLSQDPTHVLWHLHKDDKFTEELYIDSTKDTFFQKTTFKHKSAHNPKPGTVADFIINDKIKLPNGKACVSDTCS